MAIKKLEDGRWRVDVVLPNGSRPRRIFDKRQDAIAFEATATRARYERKLVTVGLKQERYTMAQAIEDFEASKRTLRPSSVKRYRAIFNQLRIFCDACRITHVDEFTPDYATWLYNELVKPKPDPKGNTDRILTPKPKTVNLFLQTIKALFTSEVARGHIHRHPMLHIKALPGQRKAPEYYTQDELRRFFAQPMDPAYRCAFLGLLHTGMRFAELANLTWQDVDLEDRFVHVRSRNDFKTKTHNAERAIPMNDSLFELLSTMRRDNHTDTLVFRTPRGMKLRERSLLHVCKRTAVRAGIESRAFLHKFRHTFASHLVQQRKSLESIKALLGHATIKESEVYAHNKTEHLREEVRVLDSLLD